MTEVGSVFQQGPVVLVSFDDDYATRFIAELEQACPTIHVSPLQRTLVGSIQSLRPSILVFDLQAIKTEDRTIFEVMSSVHAEFTQCRIIALGRQNNSSQVISAMKAGACDFLDRDASSEEIRDAIALQLINVRAEQTDRAGKVIALISGRENEGENEIAVNLAASVAQKHAQGEVLLLDLTLEDSLLEIEFNVEVSYSVRDALDELLKLDKPVLMEVLAKHETGLRLLPLTTHRGRDGEISPQELATLLGALRNFFSIIMIKGGCLRDKYCQQYLIPLCDRVLVICPQTIGAMRAAREMVPENNANSEIRMKFGLVVSKHETDIELSAHEVGKRFNIPLIGMIPAAWTLLANSHNLGVPLVISAPSSRYARAIRKLTDDLLRGLYDGEASSTTARPGLAGWFGAIIRRAS
jgi:pilus assembly protein CpaE